MQEVLSVVRALHFASVISLAGALAFLAFVALPARRTGRGEASLAAACPGVTPLIWTSLVVALVSAAAWLLLEARSMSGRPLGAVLAQGIVGVVLSRTEFGHDWTWRGFLALPLLLCLIFAGRGRSWLAAGAFWLALLLSAAELMMLAGAGHAAAGTGWSGDLHLAGDSVHLLAAGLWLGGLLPLAMVFAAARRDGAGDWLSAARRATQRFSLLGIIAVGTLVASGIFNTIFLVSSVPALLGTEYGHLLLLKIALFLTMLVFAAVNRQWLTPQLVGQTAQSTRETLRQLQRNAVIEAGLAAALLLVLGVLGTTAPALHVQPQWPLPFTLSLAEIETVPRIRWEALLTALGALAGLAFFAHALLRPRHRTGRLLAGLFLFFALGWWPLQYMIVTAYPTSFYRSTVPLTAPSVAHGATLYAETCSACHGSSGRGDGALAKSLPVAPADLTAEHIFGHSEGDLFWWISQGIPEGGMPGFAETVDERGRWDLINFIRARASALQPLALRPEVTSAPAPTAPDFAFEEDGAQDTLWEAGETQPVLLVLYRLPASLPRLSELAHMEGRLRSAGLRLLALSIGGLPGETEAAPLPDFAIQPDPAAASAYRLFEGDEGARHCEFLVDRAHFLRARWQGSGKAPLPDAAQLLRELTRSAELPMAREQAHVHAH